MPLNWTCSHTPDSPKNRVLPAKSRASVPKTETDLSSEGSQVVVVSHFGDIVLDVSKDGTDEHVLLKVDSSRLTKASKYFAQLLDPNGFREGKSLHERREVLRTLYPSLADVPNEDLPRVSITDIGQTSALKSIKPIVTDFLRIVHGYDILTAAKSPPSVNLANLAVLADRFDTKEAVSSWIISKRNWAPRILASLPVYDEEIYRQRLLICLFLGNESRLAAYSSHLLLQGSVMWKNTPPPENRKALWWDLPMGIEEELQFRRMCVLDTIISLQDYILRLYTSKSRELQCRLGYDSSPQCHSFQLGEFVSFLTRIGTLRFCGGAFDNEEPEIFAGDIRTLIKDLRACPSYQVDANHSHCGPKKLLVAGLDFIDTQLGETSVGVCYRCWQAPETSHCWSEAKRLPFYKRTYVDRPALLGQGGCDKQRGHDNARDFFMAVDRTWPSLLEGR